MDFLSIKISPGLGCHKSPIQNCGLLQKNGPNVSSLIDQTRLNHGQPMLCISCITKVPVKGNEVKLML